MIATVYLALLLSITISQFSNGETCVFPQVWQNHQWLDRVDDAGIKYFIDYNATHISTWNTQVAAKYVYECGDSYTIGGSMYYTMIERKNGVDMYTCVASYTNDIGIYHKQLTIGDFALTAQACEVAIKAVAPANLQVSKWRLKFPADTILTFPWPLGRYQTTITDSTGAVRCIGDQNSYIEITENILKLNVCIQSSSLIVTSLVNLGTAPGSMVSSNSDGGSIILLGNNPTRGPNEATTAYGSTNFYCAWFKIVVNKVYLSIDLNDASSLQCDGSVRYDTATGGRTALTLTGSFSTFPQYWQDHQWLNYVDNLQNNKIHLVDFNITHMIKYNNQDSIETIYQCIESETTAGNGMVWEYHVVVSVTGSTYIAIATLQVSSFSMVYIQRIYDSSVRITDIKTIVTTAEIEWRVMFPPTEVLAVPFPAGVYQAIVTAGAGNVRCAGDSASTVTISEYMISISFCRAAGTLVETGVLVNQGVIDASVVGLSSSQGQLIILVESLPPGVTPPQPYVPPKIFCSWFKVSNDKIFISLNTAGDRKCDRSGRFDKTSSTTTLITLSTTQCSTVVCQNGGACTATLTQATCQCRDGFTGDRCQENISECASFPCASGATCEDRVNSYTCRCPNGYSGTHCEIELRECASNPCHSESTCIEAVNGYTCSCKPGYAGTHCNIDILECASNPCAVGSFCVEGTNGYTCRCPTGVTGTRCNIDIVECISNPCASGSTCVEGVNGYTCLCPSGYTGTHCETEEAEKCNMNLCDNGSICKEVVGGILCDCRAGFTGNRCQTDVNECVPQPCYNGATCINLVGRYECRCVEGFTGIKCQQEIRECVSNPCASGSTCIEVANGYTCRCLSGYTGTNCDIEIQECASNPCLAGSTCLEGVNGFTCRCQPGYTGTLCMTDVRECASNPCATGSFCEEGVNSYTCRCPSGYTGVHCERDVLECVSNPCRRGSCVEGVNGYTCTCNEGFTGTICDQEIRECASNPCLSGSTCEENINAGYTCRCVAGYTGKHCDVDINECATRTNCGQIQCAGAPTSCTSTCVNYPGNFICLCKEGIHLDSCEDCAELGCKNNASCSIPDTWQGKPQTPICVCEEGWTGSQCHLTVAVKSEDGTDIRLIIGLLLAAALLIFIVLIIWICCCSRKYNKEKEIAKSDHIVTTTGPAWFPEYTTKSHSQFQPPPAVVTTSSRNGSVRGSGAPENIFHVQLPAVMAKDQPGNINVQVGTTNRHSGGY